MSTTRKIKADYVDGVFTQLNYIDTSTANDKITLWNRFLDTAASRPEDGTGGSPSANVTWTRTTSDPIQGEGSFLYSKLNGVNTRGEGVSRDITIPSGQKARMQSIRFDYRIASGTYSGGSSSTDSDLIVYMYRTTATGRLIEPSVIKLDGGVIGVNYSYQSEFQADSDATGYRFIIFSATTSTSNFTVQFDNFYVGPSKNVTGAIITEPRTYVPTLTATTSNPTKATTPDIDIATWYRNGKYMHIQYNYRQSNNTGAAAGSGTYLWSLPGGYAIDTAYLETAANFGSNTVGASSGYATAVGAGYAYAYNSTNIGLILTNETSSGAVTSSFYAITNATARYSFDVVIPIVGWGATATLGQDADTRVVAARATLTTAQTGVASKVIPFNSVQINTFGALNSSTGIFTAPIAGQYRVSAGAVFGSLDGVTNTQLQIRKNSATYAECYMGRLAAAGAANASGYVSDTVPCVAGDTIEIYAVGDASFDIDNNGSRTFVSIERLPGPSQIAASDFIGVGLRKSATQSYTANATFQNVTFVSTSSGSLGFDTNGSWNGTDTFTAPAAGKYEVSCSLAVNSTNVANADYELSFLGGGSSQFVDLVRTGATGVPLNLQGTATFNLIAGQTITIRFITTANHSVNNLTINTNTNASIKRIG